MPIAFDTTARRTYTLAADKKLPETDRPRFYFRFFTRREKSVYLQLGHEDAAAMAVRTADELVDLLYQRLGEAITGWDGLVDRAGAALPYDAANLAVLDGVLTDSELWELYWAGGRELDEKDLAFFASRPSSGPEESVNQEPKAVLRVNA